MVVVEAVEKDVLLGQQDGAGDAATRGDGLGNFCDGCDAGFV